MIQRVIPKRHERLAISRLLIDLAKAFHQRTFVENSHGGKPFGSEVEIVFVAACVAIGDFEGRPMSASDVAHYLSMPRATVQRKLDELIKRDILKRVLTRYSLSDYAVQNGEAFVGLAHKVIAKAHLK